MFRAALTLLILFSLLTGGVYPALITGIGQLFFRAKANGGLIEVNSRVVGSSLIGQSFTQEKYFFSRPSATSAHPYDASASMGSNLGPTNPALVEAVKTRGAHLPVDLVTTSASGLDPHISPESARHQAARVAKARGLPLERVQRSIEEHTEERTFGIWGEPRVNVLELNLALDAAK